MQENHPSISVAMGACNGERFLPDQLDSLARQTLLPRELVVTDDASEDRTVEIIERFARRATFPVRIVRNARRLGFADNFLKAASMCTGELIAFCDQDDIWTEIKLARCAEALREKSVVLAIHAGAVIDAHNRPMKWKFPDIRENRVVPSLGQDPWRGLPGFAMVFRADMPLVFARRRPWGGRDRSARMYHDQWVRFLANVFGVTAYIAESLTLNRRHGANVTDPSPVGTMAGIRAALAAGAREYVMEAGLYREWAAFLGEEGPLLAEPHRAMAAAGASYYHGLEAKLLARSRVYSQENSLMARIGALVRLAREGGYRGRTRGGLGLRSLLKDVGCGVLWPRHLRASR